MTLPLLGTVSGLAGRALSFAPVITRQIAGAGAAADETVKKVSIAAAQLSTSLVASVGVLEAFIGANERFQAAVLSSESALLSNSQILQANGRAYATFLDQIKAGKDVIESQLAQLQKDSIEISGLTSSQLNDIFSQITSNSAFLQGQTGNDSLPDAIRKLTLSIGAAGAASGISGGFFAQEIRALVSGQQLNSPNTRIAQTFGISKAEFERAQAQGKAVEFLLKKLEPAREVNKLQAQTTISGVGSNILEIFEQATLKGGAAAFKQLIADLNTVFDVLKQNSGSINEVVAQIFNSFFSAIRELALFITDIGRLAKALLIDKLVINTVIGGFQGLTSILAGLSNTLELVSSGIDILTNNLSKLSKIEVKNVGADARDASGQLIDERERAKRTANNARVSQNDLIVQNAVAGVFSLGRTGLSSVREGFTQDAANSLREYFQQAIGSIDGSRLINNSNEAADIIRGQNGAQAAQSRVQRLKAAQEQIAQVDTQNNVNTEIEKRARTTILQQQIDLIESTAKALNINIAGDVVPIKFQVQPPDEEQIKTATESINRTISTFNKSGNANIQGIQQLAENYGDLAQKVSAVNSINSTNIAIEAGENLVRSEFLQLEQRTKINSALEKLYRARIAFAKNAFDAERAVNEAAVKEGALLQSRADANVAPLQTNIAKQELKNTEAQRNSVLAVNPNADTSALDAQIKEQSAKIRSALADQVSLLAKAAIADADQAFKDAQQIIAQRSADNNLIIAQNLFSRNISTAQEQLVSRKVQIDDVGNSIIAQKQLFDDLNAIEEPQSLQEQQDLEDKRIAAQDKLAELTKQQITLQLTQEKQLFELAKQEQEIRLQIRNLGAEELAQSEKLAMLRTGALQAQVDLLQQVQNLVESQNKLTQANLQRTINRFEEISTLTKRINSGKETAAVREELVRQRSAAARDVGGTTANVDKKLFDATQDQIVVQIDAEQQKLIFARAIFELEEQRTKLSLQQQESAAQRQLIEAQINREKLEAQKIEIEQNIGNELSPQQQAQRLELVNRQIALADNGVVLAQQSAGAAQAATVINESTQTFRRRNIELQQQISAQSSNDSFRKQSFESREKLAATGQFVQTNKGLYLPNIIAPQSDVAAADIAKTIVDPELRKTLEKLNNTLEQQLQQKSTTSQQNSTTNLQVTNNFPDQGGARAARRINGY